VATAGAGYRRLRLFLIAWYLAFAAGTIAVAAWYLHFEYQLMLQTAYTRTATLTRALEEHVLRTFTTIDNELRDAGRRLIEMRALERPGTPRVVEVLREEAEEVSFLRSIYVYDAAGRGHTTSLGADIRHLRARDFESLREILESHAARPVVGRVISGAVTQRPNIPVARAVLHRDGRLAGIIGTAIEPGYFAEFYKALNLDSTASLVLLRSDGTILVRFPEVPGRPTDVSGTRVFREHIAREAVGTVDIISPIDGVRRIVSFRHVPGWNLIVVNTQMYDAVIAPWWRMARVVGSLALVSLGIFLALLLLSLQEVKRRAEAEERYALAVRGTNDGVWDWNIETNEDYLSPRWKEIVGYRDDELPNVRASFTALVHPDDRALVEEAVIRHLRNGEPYKVEFRLRHKDGSYRWVLGRGEAVRDARGKAVRMAGSISDITERRRAEERLRSALAEKEVLLKEIYHRVKNNLQVVSGLLNMQGRGVSDAGMKQLLQESSNRVKSMALVHEQLYRSGDLSNISFREYVEQLVEHLMYAHRPLSARVPIRVEAEEVRFGIETAVPLGLIVNELVSNAYKHGYGPEANSGQILLRVQVFDDERVCLTVIDDGRGLPEGFDAGSVTSLGMQLVVTLSGQLGGELAYGTREGGTFFQIVFRPERHEAQRFVA